ncbi:MAG: ATP-binding cassette domain-containing protein [Ruminococcaceae bacterium]|nr:ATP-binding cassette domain-containing protein [Oscillospiraceae bacterium]
MLEIKNLCFSASDGTERKDILKNIDLNIENGTFLVLTGPNGGGKTTLAKAISGIVQATGGKIIWNGTDISDMSITERAHHGISYGFQQPPRFTGMTVKALLQIAAGGKKLSRLDCCNYLNKVGLCAADYVDREVDASLSGGEVKRIEIATILARGNGLMIFDEPEAGIDLWSFAKLTETFRELHKESDATIIIISHQERIISLADEICVLSGGEIAQHGARDEIFPKLMAGDLNYGCQYMRKGN